MLPLLALSRRSFIRPLYSSSSRLFVSPPPPPRSLNRLPFSSSSHSTSSSSSSADDVVVVTSASGSSVPSPPLFKVSDSAALKLLALCKSKSSSSSSVVPVVSSSSPLIPSHYLRLSVDAGGCSGFQYKFELEPHSLLSPSDITVPNVSYPLALVVTDDSSAKFLLGATVDFANDMIKSGFVVAANPLAESACGCGSSFALKNFAASSSGGGSGESKK